MDKACLNLAIVGCGAITQRQHLPCLATRSDCRVVALVDENETRAKAVAEKFGVPQVLTDYRDLPGIGVDASIVALPNHLHAPVSIDLLRAGVHVLVEKPMALSTADCDAMLAAAEEAKAVLSVGLMRRFSVAAQFVKSLIDSGMLGRIRSFDIRDGFVYSWSVTTDFFLRKELAGGGVLIDLGAHSLDQMLWWLGEVESFEYYDDNYGGVEADCELHVRLQSGADGIIEVSRTRNLRNTAIIRGERAEIEVDLVKNSVVLTLPESLASLSAPVMTPTSKGPDQKAADLIAAEHADFFETIRGEHPPQIPGSEGKRSVALVEACYANRGMLRLPWVELSQS